MAFEVEAHSKGIFDFGQAVQVGLFDGDIDIGIVAARQMGHHIARCLEERIVSREIDYGICAPHPRLEVEAIERILVVAQLLNVSFRHEIGTYGRYGKPTSGSAQTTGEGRERLPFEEVTEGEACELEHRLIAFAVEPYGSAAGELSMTEIDAELCAIVVALEIQHTCPSQTFGQAYAAPCRRRQEAFKTLQMAGAEVVVEMAAAFVEQEIFQKTIDFKLQHIGQLKLCATDGEVADIALHLGLQADGGLGKSIVHHRGELLPFLRTHISPCRCQNIVGRNGTFQSQMHCTLTFGFESRPFHFDLGIEFRLRSTQAEGRQTDAGGVEIDVTT